MYGVLVVCVCDSERQHYYVQRVRRGLGWFLLVECVIQTKTETGGFGYWNYRHKRNSNMVLFFFCDSDEAISLLGVLLQYILEKLDVKL